MLYRIELECDLIYTYNKIFVVFFSYHHLRINCLRIIHQKFQFINIQVIF